MSNARILFVNSFFKPEVGGGAELTLHTIATGLAARGHNVAVAVTADHDAVDHIDGITVYRVKNRNIFWKTSTNSRTAMERAIWQLRDRSNLRMQKELLRVAIEFRPDIVSYHNLAGWSTAAWSVANYLKVPAVQVIHDYYLLCPRSNMFKRGVACSQQCASCRVLRRGVRSASRALSAVVGVSNAVLDPMFSAGLFDGVKPEVIYNAIDLERNAPRQPREGRGLTFGYIGSLVPAKGLDWLITEWLKVSPSGARLLIAGKGPALYEAKLRAMLPPDSKSVEFIGYADGPSFYPKVDVLVVPSIWQEPLGRVAIEAGAYGIPVVTTSLGGLKEIVSDGVSGVLCDPDRPEELGEAIRILATDSLLRRKMGLAAKDVVAKFTSSKSMVDQYELLQSRLMVSEHRSA